MKKSYLDVIERMKEISESATDTELATLLGVQKSSISAYKNRGIPKDKLIIFSQKYNVDLNWLESGEWNGSSYEVKEWFSAKELEGLGGLPAQATNITRKAKNENWKMREAKGIKGGAFEYHISSLPDATKEELGFNDSVRVVNLHEPLADDTIRVEILDIEASAGNGAFLTRTEQGLLAQEFDLDFFRRQFGRKDAKNLKIIAVKGDSMSPTLESGDLLYVDVAENYFSVDGLYVFTFGDSTFIKRLQKVGREMWAISDNKANYKDWAIPQDEPIYIHGRVVFSLPMKMKKW